MATMEWKEVTPEQSDWKRQINIVEYYSGQTIASIILYDDERNWHCVIDGYIDFLSADTEEEAKKEMIEELDSHFESEIDYYEELRNSLSELND